MDFCAQNASGCSAAGTAGADQMVEVDAGIGHFLHAVHIAQTAQSVGSAAGDFINFFAKFCADPVHFGVNIFITVGVHIPDFHAHQMVQNLIALPGSDTPLLQHQNAVHSHPQRAGSGEHGMVALGLTGGHYQVVALLFGIVEQIFQLSDLVAAQGHTAEVIPLDPDVGAQSLAHVGKAIHGGGEQSQGLFFKVIHRSSYLLCMIP